MLCRQISQKRSVWIDHWTSWLTWGRTAGVRVTWPSGRWWSVRDTSRGLNCLWTSEDSLDFWKEDDETIHFWSGTIRSLMTSCSGFELWNIIFWAAVLRRPRPSNQHNFFVQELYLIDNQRWLTDFIAGQTVSFWKCIIPLGWTHVPLLQSVHSDNLPRDWSQCSGLVPTRMVPGPALYI